MYIEGASYRCLNAPPSCTDDLLRCSATVGNLGERGDLFHYVILFAVLSYSLSFLIFYLLFFTILPYLLSLSNGYNCHDSRVISQSLFDFFILITLLNQRRVFFHAIYLFIYLLYFLTEIIYMCA